MKAFATVILVLLTSLLTLRVHAEDAALKIDGDLMIHPDQVADFFTIGADQISSSSVWNWQSLQFTKPYKTSWSNVQAHGPFNIQFDTTGLINQEIGFSMSWADPALSVGTFEIHDTITRNEGATIIVHLDGTCTNMQLHMPGGQWVVKGKMRWDFTTKAFVATWENFNFSMNTSSVPQVNLGQCQGQPNLIKALQDTVTKVTSDQAWLQDVLKQGILDWMQNTLGSLQAQLLVQRDVQIKEKIKVSWIPQELTTLSGGLLRVAGNFVLSKPGATLGSATLARDYDPRILTAVLESGFVMPKNSLQSILNYMYSNGELQYRLQSSGIPAFQSLMNSRFFQFFIWPDLMNFATSTGFYFDLASERVPQVSNGQMLDSGGSVYDFTMPMVAHQWAPDSKGNYLPYVDFTTPVTGQLSAQISDGTLSLQLKSNDLQLVDVFRSEFAKTRDENNWIATSILGSNVKDYLNQTPFNVAVPSWQVGSQLSLALRDLQAWTKTFRIPIQFVPLKP